MRSLRRASSGVLLAAVISTGCGSSGDGGSDSEQEAKDAAIAWVTAVNENDGAQLCALVGGELKETVDESVELDNEAFSGSGTTCEKLLLSIARESGAVRLPEPGRAQVTDDRAEVEVVGAGDRAIIVRLRNEAGEWHVVNMQQP